MPANVLVFEGSASYPSPSPGPVVTIGNFDGVHLGHRALVDRAVQRGRELGRPVCAYTFDPAPVMVLRPEQATPRIQTLGERIHALGAAGVDHVVVERFDRDFAAHDAEWFAREVLQRRLGAHAVVVGWDFRFGRGRSGGVQDLARVLPIEVEQVEAVKLDGETVSSSRIRALVADGDVAAAARLLGRPHRVVGEVVHGDGRGRQLGFPTANVAPRTELLPGYGVYAVRAEIERGGFGGVVNLGVRPTFGGSRVALEVHLLDFEGDLYGQTIALDFAERIRGEQRFASVDELVAQIARDVSSARALLASSPR